MIVALGIPLAWSLIMAIEFECQPVSLGCGREKLPLMALALILIGLIAGRIGRGWIGLAMSALGPLAIAVIAEWQAASEGAGGLVRLLGIGLLAPVLVGYAVGAAFARASNPPAPGDGEGPGQGKPA